MSKQAKGRKKMTPSIAETMRQIEAEKDAEASTMLPPAVLPTPVEQERIAAWKARFDARGVPLATPSGPNPRAIQFSGNPAVTQVGLAETMGVTDPELAEAMLRQVVPLLPLYEGQPMATNVNLVLSSVKEIGPKDGVEGMLAAQMVATHTLAMKLLGKAAETTSPDHAVRYMDQATKLQRTYLAQVEALNRHRGKGQQKVTVEYQNVNVQSGGQAVVGTGVSFQGSQAAPNIPQAVEAIAIKASGT